MTTLTTVDQQINRDRFGRPYIIPPGGGKPVPYTRVTTLAGTLDDMWGLTKWKMRTCAVGLADRKDLLLAVSAHRDDKSKLDQVCDQAMEVAGSSSAATIGTAVHKLSELVDDGRDIPPLSDEVQRDLDAYRQAMEPFEVVAMEQFCVLDDLKVAGTPDRIVKWNGQYLISDLKTSKDLKYSLNKISCQLALYSRSRAYDIVTGQRTDLPPVSQTSAIVIHVPAGRGDGTAYWIDIKRGWEAVQLALQVREWRKAKGLTIEFGDHK